MADGERKNYEITVAGRINDARFQQARVLARFLAAENSNVQSNSVAMTESEWEEYLAEKTRELGGAATKHRVSPIVFYNNSVYIGGASDLISWMNNVFGVSGKSNTVLYNRMANKAYRSYIDGHKHPHCFLDISVGGGASKRVVVELYSSVCPRTCENFRALCTGEKGTSESGTTLSFKGTPIHRVVSGGWVQGGDICGGHGDGGESIYGATFADETFDIKHNRAGILSMASSGAHSNASQWFITLAPLPFLDGQRVAFGRVISGLRTIRSIERLPSQNQRPQPEVTIADCGVFAGAVYGTPPAGVDESKREEAKSNSEERVRTALYARIYNSVDTEGSDAVSGTALADALVSSGGAVFKAFFVDAGAAALDSVCRAATTMSFETFTARGEEVYRALHRGGGVELAINNPFGDDSRPRKEQVQFMDLRRPATKRKLLYELFTAIDTSGDGRIDRMELLTALRNPSSKARTMFPTHTTELGSWLEASTTSDTVSFAEFHAIASRALSLPGGR